MGKFVHLMRGILALACLGFLCAGSAQAEAPKPGAADALAGKYDTSLPVEISADNLEVLQHDSKAIFKGNVIAVQGKIRLKADMMIVHYKQDDKKSGQPAGAAPVVAKTTAGSSPDAKSAMGAITLIEVEGNVLLATVEESAKGDKGTYQVPERLLHLTGDNVVLTRDKNILRGTALEYNLETGRSVLTNKGAKVGNTNGGRVRGVFVPNQEEKGKEKKKSPEKVAAPAAPTPAAEKPAADAPAAPTVPAAQ
jgi:lipopolysaccharide export system protein LptA